MTSSVSLAPANNLTGTQTPTHDCQSDSGVCAKQTIQTINTQGYQVVTSVLSSAAARTMQYKQTNDAGTHGPTPKLLLEECLLARADGMYSCAMSESLACLAAAIS